MKKPKIYEDSKLKYRLSGNSDRHYSFSGNSLPYCLGLANDIAAQKMETNEKAKKDPAIKKWEKIDIAVVPHPEKKGLYLVEDRSKH